MRVILPKLECGFSENAVLKAFAQSSRESKPEWQYLGGLGARGGRGNAFFIFGSSAVFIVSFSVSTAFGPIHNETEYAFHVYAYLKRLLNCA